MLTNLIKPWMVAIVLFAFGKPLFAETGFFCLGNEAAVLEYSSVYDVHPLPNTNYFSIRSQPANFDTSRILADLQKYLVTTNYDFVLIYSLREVPGWINAGTSYSQPLGRNIGFTNATSGQSWAPAGWTKLRSTPHMNAVSLINRPAAGLPNYGGALTVFHECFHHWGPNITRNHSVGPREWQPWHPVAWLAQAGNHWSWNFVDQTLPGIMYSGPTTNRFNAFDLYLMGVMGYAEASTYSYAIYEENPNDFTDMSAQHQLTLTNLIYALSLNGSTFYQSNGRRNPDLDTSVTNLQTLTVIIKGQDEQITQQNVSMLSGMVLDLPSAWGTATWGRSTMGTRVNRKPTNDGGTLRLHLEKAGPGYNA